MTAIPEFIRLECTGLWRDAPDAQRREVVVALGDATLVIGDPKSNNALAHWSLPAVQRLNPGRFPALFTPGTDAVEELEIDDAEMIRAIDKVRAALESRQPKPGRLRGISTLAVVAAVAAGAIFWLPDAMVRHASRVAPMAARAEIGDVLLADVTRVTGQPCASPLGQQALDVLQARLFTSEPGRVLIVPDGLEASAHLPGGIVLLSRSVVEGFETPEVAAGYILAEQQRAADSDPLTEVLDRAGILAALRLLTTGKLVAEDVHGQAETIVSTPPAAVADSALLARFTAAGIDPGPYARALDPTGETTLALIEAETLSDQPAPLLMSDADWLNLQAICTP